MRILNLFAGVGGNRAQWGDEHDITAVEIDRGIARTYSEQFPRDHVIVGDAMKVLEATYADYDFIWSSPPCPSHGQYRHRVGVLAKGYKPIIPDMTTLYGAIVFLRTYHRGYWAVENTIPYYAPLIRPTVRLQRHLIWANYPIPRIDVPAAHVAHRNRLSDFEEIDLSSTDGGKRRLALRNRTDPRIGKHVLDSIPTTKREVA